MRTAGPIVEHTLSVFQSTPLAPDGLLASMDSCSHSHTDIVVWQKNVAMHVITAVCNIGALESK